MKLLDSGLLGILHVLSSGGGVRTGAVRFQMVIMSAAPKTRQILFTIDSHVMMAVLQYSVKHQVSVTGGL